MGTNSEKGKYAPPEGSKIWEYFSILTCSIMGACLGFVIGWNSPSIVKLMADDSPISVTPSGASTLAATVGVGHMLAPPLNALIVDKFGRKNTMLLSALPLLISWSLITIATSIWVLYIARFLAGIGFGVFVSAAPMYIGEISSPDTRGAVNSLSVITYNIGILVTFIIAPHLSLSVMAGIFLFINAIFVVIFWFMPESPYFLVMRNRMEEAEEMLEKLRGKTDVSEEFQTIVTSLKKNDKEIVKTGTLQDVFKSRGNRRAFFVVMLFVVSQHLGGFFAILTYGQLIFRATGSLIPDYIMSVVIGVTQVISAFVTTFLVDRTGRRPLILIAGIGAAVCNIVIGVFFLLKEYLNIDMTLYSWVVFVTIIISVFTFNCGLICPQLVLMSELFATEVKAISTCLIGIVSGLLGILGTKLYIWIAISLGYGHSVLFLSFFFTVIGCTLVIFHFTPETKGKTFIEIQAELNK